MIAPEGTRPGLQTDAGRAFFIRSSLLHSACAGQAHEGLPMTDDDKADEIACGSTRSRTPWKAVAIVLALVLGVVLICAAVVVVDLTDLALSLL